MRNRSSSEYTVRDCGSRGGTFSPQAPCRASSIFKRPPEWRKKTWGPEALHLVPAPMLTAG